MLDKNQSVLIWDERQHIWRNLPPAQEAIALRDHDRAFNRMRRALLTIRTLDSKLESEREAARLALQRISSAIVMEWRDDHSTIGARWSEAWFDHPAALYLAVTRDCRFHFTDAEREPFNRRIFTSLVNAAFDDFNAGRRSQPPRLRSEDMVLLQSNTATTVDTPTEMDTGYITQLREQMAKDVLEETLDTSRFTKWRQKLLFGMGPVILGLAATIALARYSWLLTG